LVHFSKVIATPEAVKQLEEMFAWAHLLRIQISHYKQF
jgi:hypothetical protein